MLPKEAALKAVDELKMQNIAMPRPGFVTMRSIAREIPESQVAGDDALHMKL